ncbi:MAG TPA: hypothetical protein PKY88_05665 [Anaerohalosphaeraceae bacterium]|nr:hypothetical protein [Anaerohalosphaeraceae bacterium]
MKPKTGLHKKVAFIFEGAPIPSAAPAAAVGPAPTASAADANTYTPQPAPASSGVSAPSAAPAARPAPAKETRAPAGARTRKKNKKDAKQTQMLILVGVLSFVLIAVLFFVLRTPAAPPKKAAAAVPSENTAPSTAETAKWVRPEPWPEQIRDPMTPDAAARTPDGGTGTPVCIVRGIVFNQTNPSAIIGNQIVCVGDTINGIKIVSITKDAVEFEKDGKRWTQTVQP